MTCRTPLQGYHIDECPNGDYAVRVNNSCKHRACPQCGAVDTQLWLERQLEKETSPLGVTSKRLTFELKGA